MMEPISSVWPYANAHKRRGTLRRFPICLFCAASMGFLFLNACKKTETSAPVVAESNARYEIGKKIGFGQSGDSELFRGAGWSPTEPEITWTDGNSAVLSFTGLPAKASLRLKMTLSGFTNPPELPAQPVGVYANGIKVADWQVGDKAEFTAFIPPNATGDGNLLKLELKIPKAISPKALGQGQDSRLLGVACFDLVIEKAG